MAGGSGKRQKADCRADTRGGSWAGIPKVLIDSAAYRDLSLHARAVLVELTARMNGYNNGMIAVAQRELVESLGCSPNRIVTAIADLMDHGFLDVTVEGQWKARQARLYRLTFVSTKTAPATNDYLRWTPLPKKSGATAPVAGDPQSATGAVAGPGRAATGAIARLVAHRRKTANSHNPAATGAVALICEPYPLVPEGEHKGDSGVSETPFSAAGPRCASETVGNGCERCARPVEGGGRGPHAKRFCSETCRKAAEKARAAERRKHESEPTPIGAVLNDTVHRLMAGARA